MLKQLRSYILLIAFLYPITATATEQFVPYTATIKGVTNKELEKALEYSSDTLALKKKPPASLSLLRLRVNGDIKRFQQLLDSRGYYAAQIDRTINSKTTPATVIFTITLGEVFVFAPPVITNHSPETQLALPTAEKLGIPPKKAAEADKILAAQDRLLQSIYEQGFPFATVAEPTLTVDHKTRLVTVSFAVSPGPSASFGTTAITGLETIEPSFIYNKIPWKQGQRYTPLFINQYEKALNDTGLFTIVEIKKADKLDNNGLLPITVRVKERLQRTIKTGVNYKTDEGPGVTLSWQHHNFFHRGEEVNIGGSASAIKRTVNTSFTRHDFLQQGQMLKAFYALDNEDTEAYFSNNMSIGGVIERKLSTALSAGLGTTYKLSYVSQINESDHFGLVSFPAYANYDSRDNNLDPTKGNNSTIQFTPFLNTLAGNANFTKEYGSTAHYFALNHSKSLILAGRAALGLIQSPSTSNVPLNERFYAGGSGSVRGYGYQSLSPLSNGLPSGGRSLIELSGELRLRVSPKVGLVGFLDGGNSFDAMIPDITNGIRLGTGAGIRYYTSFAPIRFDVGVPLNDRDSSRQSYQFYISLGQAF